MAGEVDRWGSRGSGEVMRGRSDKAGGRGREGQEQGAGWVGCTKD